MAAAPTLPTNTSSSTAAIPTSSASPALPWAISTSCTKWRGDAAHLEPSPLVIPGRRTNPEPRGQCTSLCHPLGPGLSLREPRNDSKSSVDERKDALMFVGHYAA